MEQHTVKFIQCGEVQIAASCETSSKEMKEMYYPHSVLFYTQVGQINATIDQELFTIPKNSFAVIRKFTDASLFKTWSEQEGYAKTYAFALTNEFIRKAFPQIEFSKEIAAVNSRFIAIPTTKNLEILMDSIISYVDHGEDLDPHLVELKTLEALHALISADISIAGAFKEYSLTERADMEKLMNHNFLYNIPLEDLAKSSGRSLSTFNRDFRTIFNETPHKWIKKKRLSHAKALMVTKNMRPSEVYQASGFEDLAHFSRSFKQQFKQTPSDFFKQVS